MKRYLWGSIALALSLLIVQPAAAKVLRFDMGTETSPLEEGSTRVTPNDSYDSQRGYGWVTSEHEGFPGQEPPESPQFTISRVQLYRDNVTPLLVDSIRDSEDMTFRVDLPDGTYRVALTLGDMYEPRYSMQVYANGEKVAGDILAAHLAGRNEQADYGWYRRVRFTCEVTDGKLEVRLHGDDSEFYRLLELEKQKSAPTSFLRPHGKRPGNKPPYRHIGGPFTLNCFAGLEIRSTYVKFPLSAADGKLAMSNLDKPSEALTKAVALFNDGRYADAETAFDSVAAPGEQAHRACGYMWLAGRPEYEEDLRLIPKARSILELLVRPGTDDEGPIELLEILTTFDKGIQTMLARGEAPKNHFYENRKAFSILWNIQNGDPVYYKAQLYQARICYMLDPHRWTYAAGTGRAIMEELQKDFPENRHVRYFLDQKWEETDDWHLPRYTEGTEGAPQWAVSLREAYAQLLDLSEWWIKNKQRPDGSIGGGWGDDVEMVGVFGYYGAICRGESPLAVDGASKLVDGVWNAGQIDTENGFFWGISDAEHGSEHTGDTLPMMMEVDYGNPVWVERCLKTVKLMRDIWTGVNTSGHRHWRSNHFGAASFGRGATQLDSAINYRAALPALSYLHYNNSPATLQLLRELGDALLEDSLRTDKGKPMGIIPGDIDFETDEIGGRNVSTWYEPGPIPARKNYGWPTYHSYRLDLLEELFIRTGERKYVEPIRLEAEFAMEHGTAAETKSASRGAGPAPSMGKSQPGSNLWIAAGVTQAVGRWEAILEAIKGTREDPPVLWTKDEVIKRSNRVRTWLAERWPSMTTEASATDRVAFSGIIDPFCFYTAGGAGGALLSAGVTYIGGGRNLAAIADQSEPYALRIHMYNFKSEPLLLGICPWKLSLGADFRVTVSHDANDDGIPDAPGKVHTFTLDQRGKPFDLTLEPRVVQIVDFREVSGGHQASLLPDLAVSPGDIRFDERWRYLTVTVHNIGAASADDIRVAVYDGAPEAGAKLLGDNLVSHVEPPEALVPQTVKIGIDNWRPTSPVHVLYAVIDPANDIAEITELNNTASREIEFELGSETSGAAAAVGAQRRR